MNKGDPITITGHYDYETQEAISVLLPARNGRRAVWIPKQAIKEREMTKLISAKCAVGEHEGCGNRIMVGAGPWNPCACDCHIEAAPSLQPGDRVKHETLGEGTIPKRGMAEVDTEDGGPAMKIIDHVRGTATVDFDNYQGWQTVALNKLTKVESDEERVARVMKEKEAWAAEAADLVRELADAFEQPDVHYMRKCLGYVHFERAAKLVAQAPGTPSLTPSEEEEPEPTQTAEEAAVEYLTAFVNGEVSVSELTAVQHVIELLSPTPSHAPFEEERLESMRDEINAWRREEPYKGECTHCQDVYASAVCTGRCEEEKETLCNRCRGDGGWSSAHGVWEACPSCDPSEPRKEPEKTLREKLDVLSFWEHGVRVLETKDAFVAFRKHFDSKYGAMYDAVVWGKTAHQSVQEIRSILLGEAISGDEL